MLASSVIIVAPIAGPAPSRAARASSRLACSASPAMEAVRFGAPRAGVSLSASRRCVLDAPPPSAHDRELTHLPLSIQANQTSCQGEEGRSRAGEGESSGEGEVEGRPGGRWGRRPASYREGPCASANKPPRTPSTRVSDSQLERERTALPFQVDKMEKAVDAVKRNFATIRTGRANSAMLDRIQVSLRQGLALASSRPHVPRGG